MTWEEAVIHARNLKELEALINNAYLNSDLISNVERFRISEEFKATLSFFVRSKPFPSETPRLLDIGAGNGFSSVSFALNGYSVTAVEPDRSNTVGNGAIKTLVEHYKLKNLEVCDAFGESLPFEDNTFHIVYARQAMHHASNLHKFVSEAARVLKPGGILLTCRDHVVNDEQQMQEFLLNHPLQKFYGGENAYSLTEYKNAFSNAKLEITNMLGPLDSVINYSPLSRQELIQQWLKVIRSKTGIALPPKTPIDNLVFAFFKWKTDNLYREAGRLYTFVTKKN